MLQAVHKVWQCKKKKNMHLHAVNSSQNPGTTRVRGPGMALGDERAEGAGNQMQSLQGHRRALKCMPEDRTLKNSTFTFLSPDGWTLPLCLRLCVLVRPPLALGIAPASTERSVCQCADINHGQNSHARHQLVMSAMLVERLYKTSRSVAKVTRGFDLLMGSRACACCEHSTFQHGGGGGGGCGGGGGKVWAPAHGES